ncbi:hypothetical protein MKW98_032744 [Papaver atlanticum]|uniref:Protein kinase domain-containing protein n=1 Tax=Papaver atlanticum TaxID=357466 RepID=A0AAD4X5A5_9MAGN|nr:hypothetical protein MKW98_032744 [Papaver atlanticum]
MARFCCFSCVGSGNDQAESRVASSPDVFTLGELTVATDRFDPQLAVKKLKGNPQQRRAELQAEVPMLNCFEHSNIVKMIGYHDKGDEHELFIVYELMPLRSLDLHLHGHEIGKKPLDWKTRMKVAVGVAKALEYLHDQNDPPVIYGDLKTSSILLDEQFNPKLSDFSFAKLGPTWDCRKVCGKLMGTIGYLPAEYAMTGMLSRNHDIYAFGIVLLELITGRKAIQRNLASVKRMHIAAWKFTEIADPLMEGRYPKCGLAQVLAVAEMCVRFDATERPVIADVVTTL